MTDDEIYGEEPECMRDLRETRRNIREQLKGKSKEEVIAFYKNQAAELEKELGIRLPRLVREIR